MFCIHRSLLDVLLQSSIPALNIEYHRYRPFPPGLELRCIFPPGRILTAPSSCSILSTRNPPGHHRPSARSTEPCLFPLELLTERNCYSQSRREPRKAASLGSEIPCPQDIELTTSTTLEWSVGRCRGHGAERYDSLASQASKQV
jgi:hypothetical protein